MNLPRNSLISLRQVRSTVLSEHSQKSEIQRVYTPANRLLRAVQVFLQLVFPIGGPLAVRTCTEDLFVLSTLLHTVRLTRIKGFIATYIAPLAFVLFVTMGKEAYDDYKRHLRDKEANSARYLIL